VSLSWNSWIRQIHRWLSIAFTVAVLVNFVALAVKEQAVWVGLLALFPLALLLLTGLYLFALPYATKWRGG
jgi:cellulose synthase/poly-beta-1,6-N-acetylglucosamine synthase-like glycosyltransferase